MLFTLTEALDAMERDPERARASAEEALALCRSMGEFPPASADDVAKWLEEHPQTEG